MAEKIGPPTPAHALTDGAEAARLAMRAAAHDRQVARILSSLVTEHGNPRRYDGVRITAGARSLAKLAEAAGFEVILRDHATGCVVEGLHRERRVGFRAYWTRGATTGATWHSGTRDRWKLVDISSRPIGKDAIAKTTKAKCRHDEKDTTRLVLVESPRGVPLNVTDLKKRIEE